MTFLVLAARLVLVSFLGVAAGAKLADPRGTRETLSAFGVPAAPSVPLAANLEVMP